MRQLISLVLFTIFLLFVQVNVQATDPSVHEVLQQQLKTAKQVNLIIDQNDRGVFDRLNNFYHYNDYQPVWTKPLLIDTLRNAINESEHYGLLPDDYHRAEIERRIRSGLIRTAVQKAQLDILLSDALLRLDYHLSFGKVVPASLDPDWNFKRELLSNDPDALLHSALRSEQHLKRFLKKHTQYGPFYQRLTEALAEYRKIQKAGGWKGIAAGKSIKPGMSDPRIPDIRARLQASGDLKTFYNDFSSQGYDIMTEEAVVRFQQRHNLETDGIIGKKTLAQMNVSVSRRIDQIRANLERIRWVRHNLGEEFVLVNIAGYQIYYIKNNQLIWDAKVQVGKDFRKTPVFRDEITYLVFNPTWTVPPTILSEDILPELKKDSEYLQKHNMNVVDFKGRMVNVSDIHWSEVTEQNFPYLIRQESGPKNPLGRVKIMFPNKHQVYLHDTPNKRNFYRTERAFSSGCIRVERPFELVQLLMKDNQQFGQSRFQEILDTGELKNVRLPQPVPILLLYFTALKNKDGQIHFFKDIYNRDDKIITGLGKPFRLIMPAQKAISSD